jgi:hypothetical protein
MRSWTTIYLLLALLIGAICVGYISWNLPDVAMPLNGYVAMGIGIIFAIVVGFTIVVVGGLMALMFYSRHGYDEPPSRLDRSSKRLS